MGNACVGKDKKKAYCVFCDLSNQPDHMGRALLFEDKDFVAFKDISPDAEFHFLVVCILLLFFFCSLMTNKTD